MKNPAQNPASAIESDAFRSGPIRIGAVESREAPQGLLAMTERMVRGDDEAFNRFYETWFDGLHRYLLILSGGREDIVADALQDAMMRIIRYAKPFDDKAAFWNWLRSVARSAFIDQIRRSGKKGGAVPLEAVDGAVKCGHHEDPSLELKDLLGVCLEDLEPEDRRLVEGKYFLGKNYNDLSREFGISQKAVESRLARIRKRLKGMITTRLRR